MKKLLLLSALALGAVTAGAQSVSDYYNVVFHGQSISNGGSVVSSEWDSDSGWYHADIEFIPKSTIGKVSFNVIGEYTGTPTAEQWQADEAAWGMPSICWGSGAMGNCEQTDRMSASSFTNFTLGEASINNGELTVQFHILGVDGEIGPDFNPADPSTWPQPVRPSNTSHYKVSVIPTVDGKKLDTFSFNVYMGPNAAGVDGVAADVDAAPVYYDFTGRRVINPAKGQLLIERKGEKARKVIL